MKEIKDLKATDYVRINKPCFYLRIFLCCFISEFEIKMTSERVNEHKRLSKRGERSNTPFGEFYMRFKLYSHESISR